MSARYSGDRLQSASAHISTSPRQDSLPLRKVVGGMWGGLPIVYSKLIVADTDVS